MQTPALIFMCVACCACIYHAVCCQVAKGGREAGGQLEKLGYAPVPAGLDLIEVGDQVTHQVCSDLCLLCRGYFGSYLTLEFWLSPQPV